MRSIYLPCKVHEAVNLWVKYKALSVSQNASCGLLAEFKFKFLNGVSD